MGERATEPLVRGPARRRASRRALAHPVATVRRLVLEHASPRSLALAAALGSFVGSLPLTGYHTVAVVFFAGRLRLNRLLALAANQIGIPPFVPFLCIETGYLLRHGRLLTEASMRTVWDEAGERLLEWCLGSLVVAPALAVVVGLAVWGIAVLTARRARRLPVAAAALAPGPEAVLAERAAAVPGAAAAGDLPGTGLAAGVAEKKTAAPAGQP